MLYRIYYYRTHHCCSSPGRRVGTHAVRRATVCKKASLRAKLLLSTVHLAQVLVHAYARRFYHLRSRLTLASPCLTVLFRFRIAGSASTRRTTARRTFCVCSGIQRTRRRLREPRCMSYSSPITRVRCLCGVRCWPTATTSLYFGTIMVRLQLGSVCFCSASIALHYLDDSR